MLFGTCTVLLIEFFFIAQLLAEGLRSGSRLVPEFPTGLGAGTGGQARPV